jgi:hypothetical protein
MAPGEPSHYTIGDIMDGLNILFLALAFAAGLAFGAMGYRSLLKRDPEKLEELAKKAKELGDKAKARF